MNKNKSLKTRMKGYEQVTQTCLPKRIPVIIRLDGRNFSHFTKDLKQPFDMVFKSAMQATMKDLCKEISGCVFGYTQSDEISLLLTDYASIKSDAWYGYNVQKMVSVAASMATTLFNKNFIEAAELAMQYYDTESSIEAAMKFDFGMYEAKFNKAQFDARAFSMPKDEVCNYFVWRQADAVNNSILSVGRWHFNPTRLTGKKSDEIQEMLFSKCNVNWNNMDTDVKRGACCKRKWIEKTVFHTIDPDQDHQVRVVAWAIDTEIPVFTKAPDYINDLVLNPAMVLDENE